MLVGVAASAADATEVRIHIARPVEYRGVVHVKRAELLLAWWGDTEIVPLKVSTESGGPVISVPLDREVWTTLAPQPPDFAYVYLEFADFVSARSERFYWLGSAPHGQEVREISLRFRSQSPVAVHAGQRVDLSLTVRAPVSRQLRLIDDAQRPVTDVTVDGWMFWSAYNHCGALSGAKPLFANVRPTADRIVSVPDGDFEYAFELHGNTHLSVRDPKAPDGSRRAFFTTDLDSPERIVRIHRHSRVTLRVHVTVDGRPRAGVPIGAAAWAACGNGTYTVGRTNAAGLLRIPDFYPDEVEAICVGDRHGQPLWSLSVRDQRDVSISLPADARIGEPRVCYVRTSGRR